jgi:hypothetical protein
MRAAKNRIGDEYRITYDRYRRKRVADIWCSIRRFPDACPTARPLRRRLRMAERLCATAANAVLKTDGTGKE